MAIPSVNATQIQSEQLLYHYTSQSGLLGIVSYKQFWASKIQYLNDAQEFTYAIALLRERLNVPSVWADSGTAAETSKFCSLVRMPLGGVDKINVFTTSFSENGNLLSQWRAYCPATGGFSLGLSIEDLRNCATKHGFVLAPCEYERPRQIALIDELLRTAFRSFLSGNVSEWLSHSDGRLAEFISIAARLKHPAFAEEKEWRLISRVKMYSDERVSFREGKSMLTPYYQFSVCEEAERFPLRHVYVGPTPHTSETIAAVKGLLMKHCVIGYFSDQWVDVPVDDSGIPYRTW